MTREFAPGRLDVNGFAEAAAVISGNDPIRTYERLRAELRGMVGQRKTEEPAS